MFEDQNQAGNQGVVTKVSSPPLPRARPPQPNTPSRVPGAGGEAVPSNLPIGGGPGDSLEALPEDIFAGPADTGQAIPPPPVPPGGGAFPNVGLGDGQPFLPSADLPPPSAFGSASPPPIASGPVASPPLPGQRFIQRKVLVFFLSALIFALLLIAGYFAYRIITAKSPDVSIYNQPLAEEVAEPAASKTEEEGESRGGNEALVEPAPAPATEPEPAKPEPEREPAAEAEPASEPESAPEPELEPEPESAPAPEPPADTDGDGLTDLEELNIGSNPRVIDTDLDGLDDYSEVKIYQSNPVKRDSDGDGYDDGTEVENGYSPTGAGRL